MKLKSDSGISARVVGHGNSNKLRTLLRVSSHFKLTLNLISFQVIPELPNQDHIQEFTEKVRDYITKYRPALYLHTLWPAVIKNAINHCFNWEQQARGTLSDLKVKPFFKIQLCTQGGSCLVNQMLAGRQWYYYYISTSYTGTAALSLTYSYSYTVGN